MVVPVGVTFAETWEAWTRWAAVVGVIWQQMRARPPVDAIEDITDRLRHPLGWRLRNPVRAIRRTLNR